jgi:hypothetical protein
VKTIGRKHRRLRLDGERLGTAHQPPYGENVCFGELSDVDVIADARAILGGVIGTRDLQFWASACRRR